MSGLINFTFFPEIKPDRISLEIAFQQGTGKEITRHWLNQAEKMVLEANQELASETGDTLLSEYSILLGATQNIGETGFHTGGITMMIEGEGKKTPVDSLISRIERKVNTIENTKLASNFFVGGGMNNFGKPIEFSISGNDGNQITNAKNRFKEYLDEIPLVTNIKDNEPLGRKEIDLKMKPEAEFYGLGIFEITKQIRQGIFGQESQRVIVGTDEVKIWVRYELSDREDEFDLNNIRIKGNDGKQILLSDLVTYTVKRGPVSLKRRDGRREIVVDASVTDPNQVSQINTQIVEEIIPKIQKEFPDVELIQRGQGERSDKAIASMKINTMILMFIIVLIMALNFESVWQALLILLAIPAGVAGAMLGHSMVGIPVSILSAFGIIALIGILVNDAIVFLDTYNRNILDGMSTNGAVMDAAKSRFRPILLTSITTVAGLLPIIMETSFQAQFLIPMAVSIAFGLIFGTIFVLFFFPMIILVHNDMRRAWHLIMNPKTNAIKDSGFDFEKEATGKGIKLLTRFTGTIYWYILVIGLIFGGVIVLKNGLMADETIVSQVMIGTILALLGILIVVIFPMSLFNKGIQKLWRNQELPLGRDVEVALVNEKHEKEREIH
jgi:multidrug efflux pump subunit AcrB